MLMFVTADVCRRKNINKETQLVKYDLTETYKKLYTEQECVLVDMHIGEEALMIIKGCKFSVAKSNLIKCGQQVHVII
jgi:hypothetical protein